MNFDFSSINLNTIIMFALAILFVYLGFAVFKLIGRIICIILAIFLLTYVLQQVGITVPILTDILNYLLVVLKPVIDSITQLFNSVKK